MEARIDSKVLDFIALVRRKFLTVGTDIKPMDLAEKASFLTMDIISDLAFGRTWGCLEQDKDIDEWFRSIEVYLPVVATLSTIPFFASFFAISFVAKLVMPSEKDAAGPGRLLRITKGIVNARFASPDNDKEQDMLASFIRHGIPQEEAVAEAPFQM
jgi:hypothetical protein